MVRKSYTPEQIIMNARFHPMARNLREKLELVIERGNLKGTCDICKNFK